jgi:arylsulfatase A-like enzyme
MFSLKFNRRDFIKLSAAALGGAALASAHPLAGRTRREDARPNIIVLVLDALSACNLSLHGYVRQTSPNLERIASRATVYHSHYSAGNFTTPGTASMLTGVYPWTHRAVGVYSLVARSLSKRSLFGLLGEDYRKIAFSQNYVSTILLGQFSGNLDERLSELDFTFQQNQSLLEEYFPKDYPIAFYAFGDFLNLNQFNHKPASLSFGLVDWYRSVTSSPGKTADYPIGYPSTYRANFTLDDVFTGLTSTLADLQEAGAPYLAYLHLLPPHAPYKPRRQFLDLFQSDGVTFRKKPAHPLSEFRFSQDQLNAVRLQYDAFIADVDSGIGAFVDALEASGILDSSILLITSDHGEMFERTEMSHGTPLMYEPVIKIPLLIRLPGQTERRDVHSVTSNVDLVPTILSMAGREIPGHLEGSLLPGFGGADDSERSVFSVFAKKNSAFAPLAKSVVAMVKGQYKAIYYRGYPKYDGRFELYNLQADPEESKDLGANDTVTAKRLKAEMLETVHAADLPYQRPR